jgi:DNA-binding MarR family transcriptional regulator
MQRDNKLRGMADKLARECLGVRVRMIHRAVSRIYDKALRPHGLRPGQMTILVGVAYAGAVKPSRLCRALHMEKSTLSRDLEALRRQGWVEIEADAQKHGHTLRLTQSGQSLLEEVLPAWQQAQDQVAELLGETGVDAMHEAAHKLGFPVRRL